MQRLIIFLTAALCAGAAIFSGCRSTPPVAKIGLVAPFEGQDRMIGYDVIYAARLAVREMNQNGGVEGTQIALVALDDGGDPEQALKNGRLLLADPHVVAVIGHGITETTRLMTAYYGEAGLAAVPLSEPPFADFDPAALPADFIRRYETITPFEEQPGPLAAPTYDGMQLIFDAMRRAAAAEGEITRQNVAKYLPNSTHQGITGSVKTP